MVPALECKTGRKSNNLRIIKVLPAQVDYFDTGVVVFLTPNLHFSPVRQSIWEYFIPPDILNTFPFLEGNTSVNESN